MTLANKITLLRAVLAMIMFICLMVDNIWFRLAAAVLFGLAALTDWLDGKIARQTGTMTPFGAIADPFVDKILVGAVYIGFASLPMLNVPLWAVFLIIARELMVSSMRVLAALSGEVLAAERAGKFKTAFQLIAAAVIMLVLLANTAASGAGEFARAMAVVSRVTAGLPYFLTVTAMLITWASGISYLNNHWTLLKNSWSAQGQDKK